MNLIRHLPHCIDLILMASLFQSSICQAELGAAPEKDMLLVPTPAVPAGSTPSLALYKSSAASGTQIHEYVNVNNIVVAVTWEGPTLPNLKELLGTHFDTFAHRPVHNPVNRHHAELVTDDLVVQSDGRMHFFAGKAYLPKLLPEGFDINQIR